MGSVALLGALGLGFLTLLSFFTVDVASDSLTKEVKAHLSSTATSSATAVRSELLGFSDLVTSFGGRPSLAEALTRNELDRSVIRFHLDELKEARTGIATAFVADLDGRLIEIVPRTPSIVGDDFSYRDWYKGVTRSGGPYVSEAYESLAAGHPSVVGVADFVYARDGDQSTEPLAILVAAWDVQSIQTFIDRFADSEGVALTVTDQRGVVVAAPSSADVGSPSDDALVRAALAGRAGVATVDRDEGDALTAYVPVPDLGWTVTATLPKSTALAGADKLRSTVLALAGILAVVLVAILAVLALVLRRQRRIEDVNRLYAAIVASSQDAVIGKTLDGTIVSWNPGAERIYGYGADEAVGQPITIIVPPDRLDETPLILESVARGERIEPFETERLTKEGRRVPVSLSVSPIRDGKGVVIGASAIARDITDKKEAENREREYRYFLDSVLENIPSMIFIKDAEDLRFVRINKAGERLLGHPRDELIGKNDFDFFPQEQADFFVARDRQVLETGEMLDVPEEPIETRHGTRVLHTKKIPLLDMDGQPRNLLGISEDVTERIQADEALRAAKEEAERANHAKSDFLSRMSHELRTPLNAILGFAQLLELEDLTGSQREAVHEVLSGGRHLLALINEVLEIARIEAGRLALSLEPVSVCDVINESTSMLKPLARERQVGLTSNGSSDDTLHVRADRQRLKQVMLNLVANAIKYNRPGGSVEISFERTSQDSVNICVTDTGIGIAPDDLPRLFSPFERVGLVQDEIEGTGLGLALSQRLVDVMGGSMSVESTLGEGSSFTVVLPTAKPQVEQLDDVSSWAPARPASDGDGRRVLYIEDNLSNLKLVEHILTQRPNIELNAAMQGRLGIDLARDNQPDLVLLDLNLPDITGAEVIAELRGDPATRSIPVVVISADATPGQIERLMTAGASDYLTKPLDVRRFLKVLDKALNLVSERSG